MFFVHWTVPDRPEFKLVFQDRKADCGDVRADADKFAASLKADGARNVRVQVPARPHLHGVQMVWCPLADCEGYEADPTWIDPESGCMVGEAVSHVLPTDEVTDLTRR